VPSVLSRFVTVSALAAVLVLPAFASAKTLTVVRSKTDANPSISASGFLERPKQFRVVITANKRMDLDGSTVTASCGKGNHSKTKVVVIRGKPRLNKSFKPAFKNADACFITMSIVGDKPGRLTLRLTGTKRKLHKQKPVSAPTPAPVPEPVPAA
jgi:hypothetical protein